MWASAYSWKSYCSQDSKSVGARKYSLSFRVAYIMGKCQLILLLLSLTHYSGARVCYLRMYDFQTFDGYTTSCILLTDIYSMNSYYPLIFSLYDPSRLNGIMQARGYPSSVWLDDFGIFASRADYGNYFNYATSDNVFTTYELRFCYNSCLMLSTLSFGWTETMMDGMIVTDNPYYFPPGSDATNYYFKVENFNMFGTLYPPSYYSGNSDYNHRVLTFFDNVLTFDVYSRALTFDDHFAKIFESNTAGSCGLVTQDVTDITDDFVYPLQGGIQAFYYGYADDFFRYNRLGWMSIMQQDGQCNLGPLSHGYNQKKCSFKPVCEFNRPHHIRTFDGKHIWIDKNIQDKLLLVKPCDATVNLMPSCWQGRVFNFAISVIEWMYSTNLFSNYNYDYEPLTFRLSFCVLSPTDPTVCQKIELDLGWRVFMYEGITQSFPWSLDIDGLTILTIETWFSDSDTDPSSYNGDLAWNFFKTITFCDGTKLSVDAMNKFEPSDELADYLRNNNCGLCGDFNADPPTVLENFRSSQTGSTYSANDMWTLADVSPFLLLADDGACPSATCS